MEPSTPRLKATIPAPAAPTPREDAAARTHVWCVYADSFDDRRYVDADARVDAEAWASRVFGVPAEQIIARYVKSVAKRAGSRAIEEAHDQAQ